MSLRQRQKIQELLREKRLNVERRKLSVVLYRWLLPVTTGVLMALAFPPFKMAQMAWLCLIPLLLALENCGRREAFRRGYIAGLVFFGMTTWWIVHVTMPGSVGLVAFLALYFGAAATTLVMIRALIARTFTSAQGVSNDSIIRNLSIAAAGTACWTTLEWVRGWFLWGGFPWNFLGVSQWQSPPLIQFANVTGVYGVSALLCFVNYAFFFTVRRFARQIGKAAPMHRLSWEFYVGMVLVCLAFMYGIRQIRAATGQESRTLQLGLVQADIPQTLKYDPESRKLILSRHRELTNMLLSGHPDLIIWPETATPWAVQNDPESVQLITNILAKSNAHLLTGFVDIRPPKMFNAAILFTPQPRIAGIYRKMHLVPFGEYIPLRALWLPLLKRIGPKDYDVADFLDLTTGDDYTVFEMNGFRFGTVICYEDTVAPLYNRFVQRDVDFMVNLTNDAWFKNSPESELHLANAIFRAVESHRPLVRATNNGITCVVSENGFIRARSLPFTQASLSYELNIPVGHAQTFYTRHGDIFIDICALISLIAIGLAAFRGNRLESPA